MASKAKPTGTRRNSAQAKKPATIDLDAKEIKAEATSTASKTDADTKDQNFGKPNTAAKDSASKPATEKSSETATKTSQKPELKKPADNGKSTAKQPASKGSFMSNLISALMGGTAALIGFGAIGIWDGARELPIIGNFYGGSQSSSVDSTQIDSLVAEIAALKENNTSTAVDLSPINTQLSALEATVSEIAATSNNSNKLDEKLAALEQEFAAVNTSLAEITAAAADGKNTSPVALSTAISSLDTRLETIEADLETVSNSVSKNPALDALSGSIGSLETQVQGITTSLATLTQSAEANAQTLSGLTEQSATLKNTVASVKASEKVAKSVAVNALAKALKNDDALSLPISSVKALIGETPETKRLEELNNSGISSRVALVSNLNKLINTVQNPNAPSKDGSISERFWANAQNMVSFRTSGPQTGDTPLAILSRVKAKVEAGELAAAKTEWAQLPDDVRKSGASWIAQLNTRIEAFALQNALNQKLTAEAG